MEEPELFYIPSGKPLQPTAAATVECSPLTRWRISWNLSAYYYGNMSPTTFIVLQIILPLIFLIAAAIAGFGVWLALCANAPANQLSEVFGQNAAKYVWDVLSLFASAVAAYLAYRLCLSILRGIRSLRMAGVETWHYQFDGSHAAEVSKAASKILRRKLSEKTVAAIKMLRANASEPYLVIRGIAPIPELFPIKPKFVRTRHLSKGAQKRMDFWKRELDTVAGGVLYLLGVEAAPRFSDDRMDEKLVVNKFTRPDVQEMPDMPQDDIYLRFHQSTIERPFNRACQYKTILAVSNFSRKPIYLLKVSDIVDCLENRSGKYAEDTHKEIFWKSPGLTKENVVSFLKEAHYRRSPPRATRYLKGDDGGAVGQPILWEPAPGDFLMAFDPARVWVHTSGSRLHAQAVMALRAAIHLASRDHVYEFVLQSRDILVVDNLRAMTARRENPPAASIRDMWISIFPHLIPFFPDFSGWWLRMVFGYPREGSERDTA